MKQLFHEVQLERLADHLFEGVLLTDRDGYILAVNKAAGDFFSKLAVSELIGQRITDFIFSAQLNHFYQHRQELRNIPLSIGMTQLLANLHVIEHSLVLLVFKNITPIQQLTQELSEAQEQIRLFRKILDAVDEGLCYIDTNEKIVFYNRNLGKLDSKEPDSVLGKSYSAVFPEATRYTDPLLNSLMSEKRIVQNDAFFSNTGKRHIVHKVSTPLFLGNKKIGALATTKDFSEMAAVVSAQHQWKKDHALPGPKKRSDSELPPIIHESKAMKKLMHATQLAADSPVNVLIYGENGTGKSLLAASLVQKLKVPEVDVHTVNCSAIPELLLGEWLFGTEKAPALLDQANGGVVILDQIDNLPYSLQERLLNAIQTKRLYSKERKTGCPLTVRFISLLSEKPSVALKKGTLLEDLFYELGGITLSVPPLRERQEDILLLIDHFLTAPSQPEQPTAFDLLPETLKLLKNYRYPGNVRQLAVILEGAKALARDAHLILPEHLPPYLLSMEQPDEEPGSFSRTHSSLSLTDQVEAFEKELICRTLQTMNFHVTKTADKLGISRQSLNYKIRKYGIEILRGDE